jgi:hypothetical protein
MCVWASTIFFGKNINPARADSEKKEMQNYFCTALNLRPTASLTLGFQDCTEELTLKGITKSSKPH